ncbi:MAG: cytidine deaminase [Bacteroidota bacterium]
MQNKSLTIHYFEFDSAELNPTDTLLLKKAEEALHLAYAPYSGFRVGAAILLQNGSIVIGNNQENAAYPSGLCAERVAMFAAASQYPGVAFTAIAITAKAKNFIINNPITPCGSCRQVMAEYENVSKVPLRIILKGESGKVLVLENVGSLLPFVFTAQQLYFSEK